MKASQLLHLTYLSWVFLLLTSILYQMQSTPPNETTTKTTSGTTNGWNSTNTTAACFVRSQVGKSGTCLSRHSRKGKRQTGTGKRIFFLGGGLANQEAKLTVNVVCFYIWTFLDSPNHMDFFPQQKGGSKPANRNHLGSCSPSLFWGY